VGCIVRNRLQRRGHHLGDLVVADLAGRAGSRLVIKPIKALVGKPPAPGPDGQPGEVKLLGNRRVAQSVRR